MKFIPIIVSAMLIVLISQPSVMGLPVNITVVTKTCPKGYEIIHSQCMPTNSTTNSTEIETTSILSGKIIKHQEQPVTQWNTSEQSVTELITSKESVTEPSTSKLSATELSTVEQPVTEMNVPEELTTEMNVLERPVARLNTPKKPVTYMNMTEEPITEENVPEKSVGKSNRLRKPVVEVNVTELNIPERFGTCPVGTEQDEHGVCQEVHSLDNKETIQGCPQGTQPDEQGACDEVKPSSPEQMITNSKLLLKADDSCPDNYKKIQGRCLYVKSKGNLTLQSDDPGVEKTVLVLIRPRIDDSASSKIGLVPVLSNSSCPQGTEYGEYGLCQKRISQSHSKLLPESDGSCPDDFELINGECTYQKSKIQVQSKSTIRMMHLVKSVTPVEDAISNEEYPTLSSIEELDVESQSEETSSPL